MKDVSFVRSLLLCGIGEQTSLFVKGVPQLVMFLNYQSVRPIINHQLRNNIYHPPPPTTGGKKKYMPKGEFKRYKVVAAFPTMKDWLLDVDDVVMDDGVQAVRNHKGHPVFPVKWEAFPKIFEEIEPCGQKEYDEAFNKWLNEK